eukprot:gene26357-29777_t
MITYPSTHGVFEETVREICEITHQFGGQVYLDGANMNAMVGVSRPGDIGSDVSHLNLHKTFCIPHGGGGPGVGPVAVRAHLAPYLPSHAMHPEEAKRSGIGPISGAPYGSAGILPISWAYIRLMGGAGLTRATATAVLSANYVAARLGEHFPVLYRGHSGLVAHECILDVRGITKETGVSIDDVAKRLVDYGFHSPTMSFPVAGTLMVEPTESEDLAEIDRFCEAMIAIKGEIDRVAAGEWAPEDSPLRGAPHTSRALVGEWDRAYPRELAVFPTGVDPDKCWPPVGRIDQAYGGRNRQCSCPPLEAHGRLPSVVAGVLQGGELVWTGAAGAGSVDERFRIGSITKTVTAVAVLQARDAGLLSLDDTIGSVVPETGYRDVTVRELLAHTGGLQSEPVGSWWERSPGVDFATLVAASGSVSEPGEFHYSNLGFALLGEAV